MWAGGVRAWFARQSSRTRSVWSGEAAALFSFVRRPRPAPSTYSAPGYTANFRPAILPSPRTLPQRGDNRPLHERTDPSIVHEGMPAPAPVRRLSVFRHTRQRKAFELRGCGNVRPAGETRAGPGSPGRRAFYSNDATQSTDLRPIWMGRWPNVTMIAPHGDR